MDRLWAPWRMDFIRAPKEEGCFLCRILREGPAKDAANLVAPVLPWVAYATLLLLADRRR